MQKLSILWGLRDSQADITALFWSGAKIVGTDRAVLGGKGEQRAADHLVSTGYGSSSVTITAGMARSTSLPKKAETWSLSK